MRLGPVGVFTFALEQQTAAVARDAVATIEDLGYGAVWVPEARGKEAFTHAAVLLSGGVAITVATGVASIWGRDPMTARAAVNTVGEAYPGRLVVGLGVSHRPLVEEVRGHTYTSPVATMTAYLDAMEAAPYLAAEPAEPVPLLLAALGPRMLALAAARTAGAHTYFVPVEHTRQAREILGPDRVLAVEQAVILEGDPTRARNLARVHTKRYLSLDNYRNNLLRLGWSADDVDGSGSDGLVDALVVHGDEVEIAGRVRDHMRAGADHVCIQVLTEDRSRLGLEDLAALAPVLLAG